MAKAAYESIRQTPTFTPSFTDLEIQNLAERYGTPAYVVDEETLRKKLSILEAAYRGFQGQAIAAYSMKANFNPSIIRVFMSEGILFDITSIGEIEFYLRLGGNPENIIYTSITEEEEEFRIILSKGVNRVVLSSHNGLVNLIRSSKSLGLTTSVLIRINPEVGVKAGVRASYKNGKFGVPINGSTVDSATSLFGKIFESENLELEGVHFHLGSQIEDTSCFVPALEKVENFILKMKGEHPELRLKILDIGGGTPVDYGRSVPSPREIALPIISKLNSMVKTLGADFTLIIESGRFLAAESSVLITRVVNSKVYEASKFIIVDAGYHLLLDAALLHQAYPQEIIPASTEEFGGEHMKINVVGRLCDALDIFPSESTLSLGGVQDGKLLVFRNTGAYSLVFNMPFHCQIKPTVLMRRMNGEIDVIRRAEKIEELFDREGGNISLSFSDSAAEHTVDPGIKERA